jgi:hypothetical protein
MAKAQNQERNPHRMTFQTENLTVDWFSLNIRNSQDFQPIAFFLFYSLNFNVFKKISQNGDLETVFLNESNEYKCIFIQMKTSYWSGLQLSFSGKNAAYFYKVLKRKGFDWTLVDLKKTSLARFDINYLRVSERDDSCRNQFLEDIIQKLENKTKKVSYNFSRTIHFSSEIIRIGKRSSSRFYRIYTTIAGMKFEFEMKGKTAKKFQAALFYGRLEEFEHEVSDDFYKHSKRILPLTHCYTDWLLIHSRRTKKNNASNTLVTTYLKTSVYENITDRETLWHLFQLLSFIKILTKKQKTKKILGHQIYYDINFQLQEFVEFTGVKTNQYQLKKSKDFLNALYDLHKSKDLISRMSETSFRSAVIFPTMCIEKKGKNNFWMVSISIAEQLYNYRYPFFLPLEFIKSENKYDRLIKIEVLHSMSTVSLKKRLDIGNFVASFSVSNALKTKIKKRIVFLIELLEKKNSIESRFILMDKLGETTHSNKLNVSSLARTSFIYFFEKEP